MKCCTSVKYLKEIVKRDDWLWFKAVFRTLTLQLDKSPYMAQITKRYILSRSNSDFSLNVAPISTRENTKKTHNNRGATGETQPVKSERERERALTLKGGRNSHHAVRWCEKGSIISSPPDYAHVPRDDPLVSCGRKLRSPGAEAACTSSGSRKCGFKLRQEKKEGSSRRGSWWGWRGRSPESRQKAQRARGGGGGGGEEKEMERRRGCSGAPKPPLVCSLRVFALSSRILQDVESLSGSCGKSVFWKKVRKQLSLTPSVFRGSQVSASPLACGEEE